jgi:hypothetical protein
MPVATLRFTKDAMEMSQEKLLILINLSLYTSEYRSR